MTRQKFLRGAVGVGLVGAALPSWLHAQPAPAAAAGGASADTDDQRIDDLVLANRILAKLEVLDGYGHISVRSVRNPKHYFMARSVAPEDVRRQDILEFDENSDPINAKGVTLYGERYIHGEILRVRPDVQCVIHSHSEAVIPYSMGNKPLQALMPTAAFLGCTPAPVFDLASVEGPDNRMLIHDTRSGAALAKTLGNRSVVLMRGHGMAVVGPNISDAVSFAYYAQVNAQVEQQALLQGPPKFMNCFEVKLSAPTRRRWAMWTAELQRAGP